LVSTGLGSVGRGASTPAAATGGVTGIAFVGDAVVVEADRSTFGIAAGRGASGVAGSARSEGWLLAGVVALD
jgi:hypothetical protein